MSSYLFLIRYDEMSIYVIYRYTQWYSSEFCIMLFIQTTQASFGDLFGKYEEAKVCILVLVFIL